MKKITSTLLSLAITVGLVAQNCGTTSSCTPTGGPGTGGFEDLNNIPCAERNVAYNQNIQFTMFSTFSFQGNQNVDSIEFVSIGNLPCGICWSVNQADKRYSANEDGCLTLSGNTNDPAGQYKLTLSLKAWINGLSTGITVPANLVDQTGIRLFARVKENAAANCPGIDTSSGANNLIASANCPVGINEPGNDISALNIAPSTFTDEATVSFFTAKAGLYDLNIIDLTGKLLASKKIEAVVGQNTTIIERNDLPGGLYFLSISAGKNITTTKFSIAD